MSRKKYSEQSSKAELFEELKEKLDELFHGVESAEVSFNDAEHADYVNLVVRPFESLIENVELFAINLSNDVYSLDIDFEENNDD